MECFKIENLTFSYPDSESPALCGVNMTVAGGEFVTLCGKSGCGKTTLLRMLKSVISPHGKISGSISFCGKPLAELSAGEQASRIGFIMQSPDNQIVTDKVWHELSFGLESLGVKNDEIRIRVAEMASYFGIGTWFHKKTAELSGGQKQLLNLASVMVMQPEVLILDEPTSQLDPIAAQEFISTLKKINSELGTTVILSEHRLEDAFPASDRIVVLEKGRVIADDTARRVPKLLADNDMFLAMPAPVRVYAGVDGSGDYPLTVREGKRWLEEYAADKPVTVTAPELNTPAKEVVISAKDLWFRYEKNLDDVIKGLSVDIYRGELFTIVGGNGSGKTTALSLIGGLNKPYRGRLLINGVRIEKIKSLYSGLIGVLPQNPQALFVKKTVALDLAEVSDDTGRINSVASLCNIEALLESHPYDLSGGEQQRAALAKILLLNPEIILLDEPTKGMDAHFKRSFAQIMQKLKTEGKTIVMVSHDIEFCAEYADRCAMFFDGGITGIGAAREFFAGKSFYTTAANRMARSVLPQAVIAQDIIKLFGGK